MEEGIHPILLDGAVAGKLTVSRQGARTVFDAWCAPMEGIVRISVYGGGAEGCLGVLAPEGDGLTLHRRLSPTEMRAFPREIERVGRAGEPVYPEGAACPLTAREPEAEAAEPEKQPERIAAPAAETMAEAERTEAPEEAVPEDAESLNWYASPDGALVCFDGVHSLIALPEGDARIPEGRNCERRRIEGTEYLVYITKNGRIAEGQGQ